MPSRVNLTTEARLTPCFLATWLKDIPRVLVDNLEAAPCGQLAKLVKLSLDVLVRS
jgi:hypothetical protein